MSSLTEIQFFLEEQIGVYPSNPTADIFLDLGVVGDDFSEMMLAYAEKYQVNMENYLWYFHHDEEGQNLGGLFFKPPHQRVERIPITPELLARCTQTKKWEMDYPEHDIPGQRLDLRINQVIFFGTVAGIITWLILKLT